MRLCGIRTPRNDRSLGRHAVLLAIQLLVSCLLAGRVLAAPTALDLTPEEQAWIEAHRDVRMGVVEDNAPYSFFRDGTFLGFSVDLIDRLEAMTGLRITVRMGSWARIYNEFSEGRLDAIEAISFTESRARSVLFTAPYYLRRTMVFHNLDQPLPELEGLGALEGKRIGIVRDIYYADNLARTGLDLVPFDGYRDLVAALAFGWIDAVLAPELTGKFFARENGYFNVAVAGPVPTTTVSLEDFRFGVSSDSPILRDILDKALAAIPDADLNAMLEHWRAIRPGLTLTAGPLRLSSEEQAFVAGTPVVRVGFMPDYWPFSYLDGGSAQGFSVDLAREVGDRTGLVIDPVFDTWPRLLAALLEGRLDMVADMSFTEARAASILFSKPYHQIPIAVFVRAGGQRYTGPDDLLGQRIGIGEDVFFQAPLIDRVGAGAVRRFARQEDMMRALSAGEVDMVIAGFSHGTASIRRLGLVNVETGGVFEIDGLATEDLRFGVNASRPLLRGVLDRAMASIPTARWAELETRWLGPRLAPPGHDTPVPLPEPLRAHLDAKGLIRVCGGASAYPYEDIDGDGTYQGLAGDLMRRLAQRGGFAWELVPADTRAQALEHARAGACDVLPAVMGRPSELPGWQTTTPYLRLSAVVATRLEHPFLHGMASLSGSTVGIVADSPLRRSLEGRYPDITFEPVASEAEGLDRVRAGDLDAAIGSLPRFGSLIARHRAGDIKIAGHLPEEHRLAMAYNTDTAPLLGQALDHLLGTMDAAEAQAILDRWASVRYERAVDMRMVWGVVLGALSLIALFVLWNRQLHRLNARLNEANQRLSALSVTDALTGLPNRASMETHLSETFALCQRNGLPFSVAMIDVDRFKAVNDDLGHAFGDTCLRQIAEALKDHFRRDGDLVFRYGGEEFVTFTAGESAHAFPAHLEALRARIAAHPVVHGDLHRSITISIGAHSGVPARGDTVRAFMEVADGNLYRAKQSGRNRVVAGSADAPAKVIQVDPPPDATVASSGA